MLTHRTNVLFSRQEYVFYSRIAKLKDMTISQLVRHSLSSAYQPNTKQNLATSIQQGWKLLKKPHQKVDYKAWIEDGRKY